MLIPNGMASVTWLDTSAAMFQGKTTSPSGSSNLLTMPRPGSSVSLPVPPPVWCGHGDGCGAVLCAVMSEAAGSGAGWLRAGLHPALSGRPQGVDDRCGCLT
jgi:hypothetical protein